MNRRNFFKTVAALALIPNAFVASVALAKAPRKPWMLGRVLNVSAIEESLGVYRVSADGVESIQAIRDGGVELTIDGDDPTLSALMLAEIAPGHARTCLSEGIFRLGACAFFPVTVDATGHGMRQRVTRTDELAGIIREGSESREWRDQIDAEGLLVHNWGVS